MMIIKIINSVKRVIVVMIIISHRREIFQQFSSISARLKKITVLCDEHYINGNDNNGNSINK